MGLAINQDSFSRDEFVAFDDRLQENLRALRTLLSRDSFGHGEQTLGAELEVYLTDPNGRAAHVARPLLAANRDPHFVSELNRFNLEINLDPVMPQGKPFSAMAEDMRAALLAVDDLAAPMAAQALPVAILPTLTESDLGPEAMMPLQRYKALQHGLHRESRQGFNVHIDGAEPLEMHTDLITLEGANTAFQVHLRVDPERFVDTFNAAVLATPLALALSGNSPFLLGHRLWQETRVALFKQSVDTRSLDAIRWRPPPRVCFGHGWLRSSPYEPFAETVAIYPPLLAPLSDEDPVALAESGHSPQLRELRLHMGTTWPWVRAVYDHAPEPHLRIEFRALPSGPTVEDMIANAALLIGLAIGTRDRMNVVLPAVPFRFAEYNFYRAAKRGLNTRLVWPWRRQTMLREESIDDIAAMMLPMANAGLDELGVDSEERRHWLGVIEDRLASRQTGAVWQARRVEQFERADRLDRAEALAAMTQRYAQLYRLGLPVAQWPTG